MSSFQNTTVKILKGADFDNKGETLKDKRCAFVLFFAEWCGHCQNLKPDYIKFADIAQFMKVYAIDSDNEKSLMTKLSKENSKVKIKGFPTIWIYKNGVPFKEYNNERNWQQLLKEAIELCNTECKCNMK